MTVLYPIVLPYSFQSSGSIYTVTHHHLRRCNTFTSRLKLMCTYTPTHWPFTVLKNRPTACLRMPSGLGSLVYTALRVGK